MSHSVVKLWSKPWPELLTRNGRGKGKNKKNVYTKIKGEREKKGGKIIKKQGKKSRENKELCDGGAIFGSSQIR